MNCGYSVWDNQELYIMVVKDLVLIADTQESFEGINEKRVDLEKVEPSYFHAIANSLRRISKHFTHYLSPAEFIEGIQNHHANSTLVWSIYGGQASRNRMALIPGICEALNIRYVGADVYSRIICQDKILSKRLAKEYGLPTPRCVLIREAKHLEYIQDLNFPVVIKPNLEGSSIGITADSLTTNLCEATRLAESHLNLFSQPILAEEFVPGKEVSICIAGSKKDIHLIDAIEVCVDNDPDYFTNNLFTGDEKKNRKTPRGVKIVNHLLPEFYFQKFCNIFKSLGKMDYMRIDGKLDRGCFHFLEFTPDAHLGPRAQFIAGQALKGIGMDQTLEVIIQSCLESYQAH